MNILGPLATGRILAIIDEILPVVEQAGGRLANSRVADQDATNGEVLMKVKRQPVAADVIQFGQVARVIKPQQVRTQQLVVPKLKHGQQFEEGFIELLTRLENGIANSEDRFSIDNQIAQSLEDLINGVLDRQEILNNHMLTGGVVNSYDAYGIQFSGDLWGTPSNLKSVPATKWDVTATATPIANIRAMAAVMTDTYGNKPNRFTAPQAVLNAIYATDEYKNNLASFGFLNLSAAQLVQLAANPEFQLTMLQAMLGNIAIEAYDKSTNVENADGSLTSVRFLPAETTYLSNSANDNNTTWSRFANTPCPEAIVNNLVPGMFGRFPSGRTRGPLGYVTAANAQLNPPGMTTWAVKCGFPERRREAVTGVIYDVLT